MNASNDSSRLSIGQCATLACVLEVTARKPGNVHRDADFSDATFTDFLASAVAIGSAIESAADGAPVGRAVFDAVRAMRAVATTNTYLGTILLLAPLAAIPREIACESGIAPVLAALGPADAQDVYEAIRLSAAGGLGKVDEADIRHAPPASLVAAMHLAADRDLVARQYTNGFADVLSRVVPCLERGAAQDWALEDTIIYAHVQMMAEQPDSLIGRKCGPHFARESADRAAHVLAQGDPYSAGYAAALSDLDFWLRSDGHRRNPGTTADLVAAGLFVALRTCMIKPPFRFYRS